MRNEGLGSWPARRARKTPHRTALVHGEKSTDYRTLYARTTRLAHALRARGVRRGDRIAYLGPNHPSYLATLFAAGPLGAGGRAAGPPPRLPRPNPPPLPGDPVRRRHPRRGVRPPEPPPRRPRDR